MSKNKAGSTSRHDLLDNELSERLGLDSPDHDSVAQEGNQNHNNNDTEGENIPIAYAQPIGRGINQDGQLSLSPPLEEVDEIRHDPEEGTLHMIKELRFLNQHLNIVLQNENGPCPLLSIINTLLLRSAIILPNGREYISSAELISILANFILASNLEKEPEENNNGIKAGNNVDDDPDLIDFGNTTEPSARTMEAPTTNNEAQMLLNRHIQDVIETLPLLQTGVDVNVKFISCDAFEFNSVVSVFDLLDIRLFHGWVVDPEHESDVYKAISDPKYASYNQAVDYLVTRRSQRQSRDISILLNEDENVPDPGLLRAFLESTASQLTYYGLFMLNDKMRERELAVVFRNNHFHTAFKFDGKLFFLITDVGYAQTLYCWEEVTDISGNNDLVAFNFDKDIVKAQSLILSEFSNADPSLQFENVSPEMIAAQQRELNRINAERNRSPVTSTYTHTPSQQPSPHNNAPSQQPSPRNIPPSQQPSPRNIPPSQQPSPYNNAPPQQPQREKPKRLPKPRKDKEDCCIN